MRTAFFLYSLMIALLLLAPALLFRSHRVPVSWDADVKNQTGSAAAEMPETAADSVKRISYSKENEENSRHDETEMLMVSVGGTRENLSVSDLLEGILLSELPMDFSSETFRAQAVAARTYLFYRAEHGMEITADSSVCCAFFSEDHAREFYGDLYERALQQVRDAVRETDGMILLWEETPACTVFHAMSLGKTEAAETVWGYTVPYLVPVSTPEPEDLPEMIRVCSFTSEQLRKILGTDTPLPVEILRQENGRAAEIRFGSVILSGTDARQRLGLRSAAIRITEQDEESVTLVTAGYGHGVGMSQYGAQYMALSGADWKEILLHYYPGTELVRK